MKLLTEYLRVKEERKKLEKREKELDARIKAALVGGESVKNHNREAYLIDIKNRSISVDDFVETFDLQRLFAVVEVRPTKVDALVELGAIREDDVRKITEVTLSHRVGVRSL